MGNIILDTRFSSFQCTRYRYSKVSSESNPDMVYSELQMGTTPNKIRQLTENFDFGQYLVRKISAGLTFIVCAICCL